MSFNALKEKGLDLDKQLRTWHDIAHRHFNKNKVDCYARTRQILMNGIEVEAWNFKHNIARISDDDELLTFLAQTKRLEDAQQTTINWFAPCDQSVLETTLGYEQVAVDLTAWLAQNEPDDYVRETFNFGLLEDFDHLYRYSQWAYMIHGIDPNDIVQGQTDIMISRPTQNHHNCNILRMRTPYDKNTTDIQTKVNILTLVSGEQQTHNYYAEHGFCYGNETLRETFAEIKDVEEEHVTMYESLIDPTESIYEKLLLHEYTEVCNYYNCLQDEVDDKLKMVWEEFLAFELGHLKIAADLFERRENRDAESVIGKGIVLPCHFESQKTYVSNILQNEIDKRIGLDKDYTTIDELPEDWPSYAVQETVGEDGSPNEMTIRLISTAKKRDLIIADAKLKKEVPKLMEKGLQEVAQTPDTVTIEEYTQMSKEEFEM